jgi:hypothetical protein
MVGPTKQRDGFGRLREAPLESDLPGDTRYRRAMDRSPKDGGRELARIAAEEDKQRKEKREKGER